MGNDEGRKHLRAFDNEFIQLFSRISETEASRAIQALSHLPNLPLPLMLANELDEKTGLQAYSFQNAKGIYDYMPVNSMFKKTDKSDSVCIFFPFKTKRDSLAQFILSEYAESPTGLQMMFPQIYKAIIVTNGQKLADISFKGVVKHELPADAELFVLFSNFQVKVTMNTTFKKSHGTIKMNFQIIENSKILLKGQIITDVMITEDKTLVYNDKTIECEVFPLKIRFKSNQNYSSQEPGKFIEDFNNGASFEISTFKGEKVGDIFLVSLPGRDRINLQIRYADGYTEDLEDLLLSVRKILNFKLVHMKPLS